MILPTPMMHLTTTMYYWFLCSQKKLIFKKKKLVKWPIMPIYLRYVDTIYLCISYVSATTGEPRIRITHWRLLLYYISKVKRRYTDSILYYNNSFIIYKIIWFLYFLYSQHTIRWRTCEVNRAFFYVSLA